ncbi:protein S100-A10-like isoform X1 [Xenopus laevis]|uniref:Protein S100-A10 n=1 Tax=Xenopus laevis TaxID=8355 RepID=A0A8J0TI40_XENLA|nr:protein S100-A10-like isoform X1 [Xenopus laevis]
MVAPSELEHAMEKMMLTFHKFAGEKNYMNREDLQKLLESEFSEFLKNQNDPMTVDKIMKDLDDCRKGQVTFHSYCSLIAGLLIASNEYYVKHMKKR